jgi:hypothetical protein
MQIGKLYKVQGTLTGDIAQISRVRLANGGADNELTYTAGTGVISGIARASVAGIEILTNLDGAEAVIIATMSVYEVAETTVTVTSDWTRVATASATVTNPSVIIKLATSGDAIDVALFQNELGAFITSPIPTVASQVTRAADQISILTSAFPYSATAGTVVFQGDGSLNGTLYTLNDGTANERIQTYLETLTPRFFVVDGGNTQAFLADISAGANMFKHAAAWAANNFATSLNGRAVIPGGAGTLPTLSNFSLGMRVTLVAQLNGHIKRLAYYASRKTNAELQVLST